MITRPYGSGATSRAGFDEIIFDGFGKPFDDNVKETAKAVEAIKSINPSIVVEGEVGYIGTSSEILSKAPEGIGALTTPQEATQFVNATHIDVLAHLRSFDLLAPTTGVFGFSAGPAPNRVSRCDSQFRWYHGRATHMKGKSQDRF